MPAHATVRGRPHYPELVKATLIRRGGEVGRLRNYYEDWLCR